jgi:hypothetical protein
VELVIFGILSPFPILRPLILGKVDSRRSAQLSLVALSALNDAFAVVCEPPARPTPDCKESPGSKPQRASCVAHIACKCDFRCYLARKAEIPKNEEIR